jgi:hypothetical protein
MPDYLKGKIYTIRSLTDDNVYVGSTIQKLSTRMSAHRTKYKKNIGLGSHKNIVHNISDWKIELYELYPCNNKEELEKKEGEIIRLIGTLNKNIAGRTVKEYYNDNIEHFKQYNKQYYINNLEYYNQYYIANKEKKKQNYNANKEYKKQYYIANKEKRLAYQKQYIINKKNNIKK